jgi:3-isopropylmalate dehydratase small subunit
LKEDYRAMLFHRARRREDGSEDPDFVLNKPQFRAAGILVTGENFGAGSSRESAIWSMLANGIRVIVAKSFADIYRENCLQNGLLPVVLGGALGDRFIARVVTADGKAPFTVDLLTQQISGPGGPDIAFEIPLADRTRLIRASTISGSRSNTSMKSQAGKRARKRRSPGCSRRGTAAERRQKKECANERTQKIQSLDERQAAGADAGCL